MPKFVRSDLKAVTHEDAQQMGEWVRLDVAGSILVNLCSFDIETALDRLIAATEAGQVRVEAPQGARPEDRPLPPSVKPSDRDAWLCFMTAIWFFDHKVALDDLLEWAKYSPPEAKSRGGRPAYDFKKDAIKVFVAELIGKPNASWVGTKANASEVERLHAIIGELGGDPIETTTARAWVASAKELAKAIWSKKLAKATWSKPRGNSGG